MTDTDTDAPAAAAPRRGFLAAIERLGNKLPDPAMIFVWLILALMVLSVAGAWLGWSAALPYSGKEAPHWGDLAGGVLTYRASNLFSAENIGRLLTEMPKTMTSFAPLGLVMIIALGAAVAERTGLFSALIRKSLRRAPKALLTPIVALVGMAMHHADAAAYLIYVPLAAMTYAAAGRHPLAGLAAAFAAVSGGYVANYTPGQIDVVLFGFTQEAARIVEPGWTMNPAGNWWFMLTSAFVLAPVIWALTDKVIEPRLGTWNDAASNDAAVELARTALSPAEETGLRRAGIALLAVIALYVALTLVPGYSPLVAPDGAGAARYQPLFGALVAGFFLVFLLTGIAFGSATGTIKRSRDVIDMMEEGLRSIAPYLVFVFFAAHFVAMFNWSRLGPIVAINGAEVLAALELPAPLLLVSVQMFGSALDLFIGSASAKWSAMAPVVVPMFMLLGISPEMTTAAYRMGDSYTNIMTPLMTYFPVILIYAQRWDKNYGVGSLLALMLPYALTFMVIGIAMVVGWVALDLPLGPGAEVYYARPGGG